MQCQRVTLAQHCSLGCRLDSASLSVHGPCTFSFLPVVLLGRAGSFSCAVPCHPCDTVQHGPPGVLLVVSCPETRVGWGSSHLGARLLAGGGVFVQSEACTLGLSVTCQLSTTAQNRSLLALRRPQCSLPSPLVRWKTCIRKALPSPTNWAP